jgi:clan AA aspartic protease (TIGR02281 family)
LGLTPSRLSWRYPSAKEATINRIVIGVATIAAIGFTVFCGWYLGSADSQVSVAVAVETDGPKTLTLKTTRNGPHHVIRAAVIGPNGHTQLVSFIVDTGATDVVLPASMIAKLGYRESELEPINVQTANGVTEGRRGFLRSLELGGPERNDVLQRVAVMFMNDADTGGYALMGMSVFGRYNMTIQDAEDQIILVKRR